MTPPCYTFSATELEDRVQLDVHGRPRKPPICDSSNNSSSTTAGEKSGKSSPLSSPSTARPFHVHLSECALLSSMVQYSCVVENSRNPDSPVHCWPVERLFRRDRSGSFMVETTAWEGGQQTRAAAARETGLGERTA